MDEFERRIIPEIRQAFEDLDVEDIDRVVRLGRMCYEAGMKVGEILYGEC